MAKPADERTTIFRNRDSAAATSGPVAAEGADILPKCCPSLGETPSSSSEDSNVADIRRRKTIVYEGSCCV